MNKVEIKSAYGKIALSEEFKNAALEKLLAVANGAPAEPAEDIPEGRPTELKPAASSRATWKLAAGAGAAAAVLALAVWGGTLLARNAQITPPNEVQTDETQTLPEPENTNYYRAISGAVGTLYFSRNVKTEAQPLQEEAFALEIPQSEEGASVSSVADILRKLDLEITEGEQMARGSSTWTEYSCKNGRFIVNSGECAESDIELVSLPDSTVISPYSCTPSTLYSAPDYLVQNCLSPEYISVYLCETRVNGRAYYSAAFDANNGGKYVVSAEGLSEDEMAGVVCALIYGEPALPENFGNVEGNAAVESMKTGYGVLNVNAMGVRPADYVYTRGTVKYAHEEDNGDYLALTNEERLDFIIEDYVMPISGEISLEGYVRESENTEIYKIQFTGVAADVGKAIEVSVLRGDYRESRRAYCAATSVMSDFCGKQVLFSADNASTTYLAEWQDEWGDCYNLTAKGLTLEQTAYLLAQLAEKTVEVYPTAAESVQTPYGAVNLYDFTPSHSGSIATVYTGEYTAQQAAEFVGSEVLTELDVPFKSDGCMLEYAAYFHGFDFDEMRKQGLDELSEAYYNEELGIFRSDKCPVFNGMAGVREASAVYSCGEGTDDFKSVSVYAISGSPDYEIYGILPREREFAVADTVFETANDCSPIYFGRNGSDYCAIFRNYSLGMFFAAASVNLELDEFAGVVNELYNAKPYYFADENGDISYSHNTRRAQINFGVKLDGQNLTEKVYATFSGTPAEAVERTVARTGFDGVTYLGAVDGIDEMNTRAAKGLSLDGATSVLPDDGSFISLHYMGAGKELYVNFADEAHLYDARRVADSDGRSWLIEGGDSGACVIPSKRQADGLDFVSGEDPTNYTWLGGKVVDGTAYYEGFRRTSGDPSQALFVMVSAKGFTPREFADIMTVLIQAQPLDSNSIYPVSETADTAHGTLVINGGDYYGTGGGYMSDVLASDDDSMIMYTADDVKELCGVDAGGITMPFEVAGRSLKYYANYAEFHDGSNYQLFRTGKPLEGETDDETFREAQQYFSGGMYSCDKTAYFADKTATMKWYYLGFTDGENYVTSQKKVSIEVHEGDFSERYLGACFEELTPRASDDFCADYFDTNREAFEAGRLSRVYVSCDRQTKIMYGGFIKNGIHFTVQAEGLTAQEYADILAQLYTA